MENDFVALTRDCILAEPGKGSGCVKAAALTYGKSPGGHRGFKDKKNAMSTFIEILISLPPSILAVILIKEKLQNNKDD
ncbi:hypothetical protein [Mobiluncus mulieris]|uniref:hypothetical protein n=1 Tax=Mobiluncus mulieris TaxID=2052 RepID=UPI001470817E|nr:hypothetical protein [Mobiluncus mulieris]NMX10923.1 hypothetical protein [Mobiluncus mulieris]